jgi:hypothetical protein
MKMRVLSHEHEQSYVKFNIKHMRCYVLVFGSSCHNLVRLTLTLTLSLFNQPKNHLPPYLVADEKPYILTITHTFYSG